EHRMPPAAKLARKLYQDRIHELRSQVSSTEQRLRDTLFFSNVQRNIFTEIEDIKAGKYDDKLAEILKTEDEQKSQDHSKKERFSERQEEENPDTYDEIVEETVLASSANISDHAGRSSTQPIVVDNDNDGPIIIEEPDVSEVSSDKRTKNANEEKKIGISFTDKKLELNNENDKSLNMNDREGAQVLEATGKTESIIFDSTEENEVDQKSKLIHATEESFTTIRTPSTPLTESNEPKYDEQIEQSSEVQMNTEIMEEDILNDSQKSTDREVDMMDID
ncbi:30903_t:CDS:2, partial [Racocetra persica]